MPQEAAAVGRRQAPPEVGGDGAQAVDHAAPIDAARRRPLHLPAHAPQQQRERAALRRVHVGGRPRPGRGMAMRQQAAAGQRDHRPREAGIAQFQQQVDHCQAGAEDQHRQIGTQPPGHARRPGIGAMQPLLGRHRRQVADREHHRRRAVPRAVRRVQQPAGAVALDVDDLRVQFPQPPRRAGRGTVEQRAQIAAVQAARGEQPGVGFADLLRALPAHRVEPVLEMRGPVGERAHVGGAHVQQMPGVAGGVGRAAGEFVALAQQYGLVERHLLGQVQRHHRAGKAGADDGDRQTRVVPGLGGCQEDRGELRRGLGTVRVHPAALRKPEWVESGSTSPNGPALPAGAGALFSDVSCCLRSSSGNTSSATR